MFSYAKEPDFVEKILQSCEWLKIDEHFVSEESPITNNRTKISETDMSVSGEQY